MRLRHIHACSSLRVTKDMNVYDFDGTIYHGDSSRDFYFYCLKRQPSIAWRIPAQVAGILLYAMKIISKTKGKELFFSFLKSLDNIESLVDDFWTCHSHRIKPWYLQQARKDDLIISASPEFLLEPICKKLGIGCIASVVNPRTGSFLGKNCYGYEKAIRFNSAYPNTTIDSFYSDSISDKSLAELAKHPFLVSGNLIQEFPQS